MVSLITRPGNCPFPAKCRWNSNMNSSRKTNTEIFSHHERAPPPRANQARNPSTHTTELLSWLLNMFRAEIHCSNHASVLPVIGGVDCS